MKTQYKKRECKWAPLFDSRDKKAIQLIAHEFSNKEIEDQLPLGESGTEKLVKRLCLSLACRTRQGLVFMACRRGLLWMGR